MTSNLSKEATLQFIDKFWDAEIIPKLSEFISIPCKTPGLDQDWQKNGYIKQATSLIASWLESQNIPGAKIQVLSLPGKSPFIYADIPGNDSSEKTVLFYGHLDKMPETEGWLDGLGAWTPVLKDGHLYGRGSVDDGYSAFTPIAAIKALKAQNIPHARCVMLLETCEECGSPDFPDYLQQVENLIGNPDLVICIDAACGNYNQLWCTASLRGIVDGTLRVEILTKGMHSGSSSGIVPSSFRIARQLLSRIEDEKTGEILLKDFYVDIPEDRLQQAKQLAAIIGDKIYQEQPFVTGAKPITTDTLELLLNKAWRPTLSVIGAEGLPLPQDAGNVLRPATALRISLRIPPNRQPESLLEELKNTLEKDPPYGAKVTFTPEVSPHCGWNAPRTEPWLEDALTKASQEYFGNTPAYSGEGGSIGIIQILSKKYPKAQFVVSGVSGPDSNPHGPNESIYIPAAKSFTCCIAEILAQHYQKQ